MPQVFAANASHHCFVSASAGTGKTKVLVDRFVNILKSGYLPESILCLTFTKTAALEMKERVLRILQKDDPSLYKKVLESSLRIQTIHSFCQELLEQHETFTILEDIDVKRLLQKAKESLYSSSHTSVIILAKTMSEMRFDELLESLISNPSLFLKWQETYGNIENYEKSLRIILDYGDLENSLITKDLYPFCLTQKGELRKRIAPEYKEIAPQVYLHRIQSIHKDMAEQTLHFLSVAELVFKEYQKLKQDRQAFDFHDLIHKAKTAPFGDLELSHILVDEAQDTSPEQWEIIFRLSKEYIEEKKGNTLFIVGDYKQSIYGFQGANPDIFLNLPDHFSKNLENFHTVSLSLSYRTTPFVLDIVDQTFNKLGTSFDTHQSARYHDEGKVVLWPLTPHIKVDYPPWGLIEEGQTFFSTEQLHAKNLGNYIENILSSNILLPSTKALPRPEDILVLFQKRSTLLNELQKVLEEKNIPSSGRDRLILYDQLIIRDLLALGHFALLEEDDYTLACILKSPFCTVSEDELYILCSRREGTLWDHLKKLNHSACEFLQSLIDKRHLPPFSFYAPLVQNMTFGDSQIVETFLDYALIFEEKEVPTLREFIEWFKTSEAYMKRRSKGCVRFMTVHASKGLQAPIVILADSTEKPSLRHDVFLVKDDILLIKPSEETPWIAEVKNHMLSRLQEEHLRLLYVAMTRAQDHLYVTGYEKDGIWFEAIQKTNLQHNQDELHHRYSKPDHIHFECNSGSSLNQPLTFESYTENPLTEEQRKGIALHGLLENMPLIPDHHEDRDLLQRLLQKFPEFFEGESEVTLATPDGLKRLDRFIEKENETWIIEYKTHFEKPQDLKEIMHQVTSYKKYVSQTHKNVRCFLFWVRLEEIQEVM